MPLDGSSGPIEIYRPSLVGHPDLDPDQRYNGYITDLRIKTKISTLTETPLPEFELGQSKTAKMALVRDLEYFSPRYNLDVLLRQGDDGPWVSIFEFAVHARAPFFILEVLGYLTSQPAFAVGPDATLGMEFSDVGYGLPSFALDQVHLYGVVREEYSTPDPPIIIQQVLPVTPVEEIPMADLTAKIVPLVYGNEIYDSSDDFDKFADGKSARLLVWESLKLAQLDFTLDVSLLSTGYTLLSWDAVYSAGSKRVLFNPVILGYQRDYAPNAWVEIRGNQLVFNSESMVFFPGSNLEAELTGSISGLITFSIA